MQADEAAVSFEPHRGALRGLAYRMLGSLAEAEDAVQDAWLRWQAADRSAVRQPRAFLIRTVARLCLDRLKAAQAQRETYVGPWLPEPVLDDEVLTPEVASELADDVSYALMLALERLSPLERAAFLLHDVFDVEFGEIAETLGRTPAACRQLAARAREHLRAARPRFRPSAQERSRVLQAFVGAVARGDLASLTEVLAADAVLYADGGGKTAAARRPIAGGARIAEFLLAVQRRAPRDLRFRPAAINGLPGLVLSVPGRVIQTMAFEVREGRIAAIYVVRNPDKLKHLDS